MSSYTSLSLPCSRNFGLGCIRVYDACVAFLRRIGEYIGCPRGVDMNKRPEPCLGKGLLVAGLKFRVGDSGLRAQWVVPSGAGTDGVYSFGSTKLGVRTCFGEFRTCGVEIWCCSPVMLAVTCHASRVHEMDTWLETYPISRTGCC